ncbi:MAG: DUF721 domain-containing protein [Acidobacteria bacterium]|nr:DUF721 domain-containing protein [Acidobacteriota bacterium]
MGSWMQPMQPIREILIAKIVERVQTALGKEETLRHLWPLAVGPKLAASTRLQAARGKTLVVAVPDRTWKESLRPLEKTILDAVNGLLKKTTWEAVEFTESPQSFAFPPAKPPTPKIPAFPNGGPEVLSAGMIADPALSQKFLESARKYFAWQEARQR